MVYQRTKPFRFRRYKNTEKMGERKMANKYAGTKTEQNLLAAFAGESEARNKYTYYASQAKKAGYEQLAALYLETADQEKEHAKMWFKEIHGIGNVEEKLEERSEEDTTEIQSRFDIVYCLMH